MPLPVERSQGSVSSLVARFQTAANRDAEQARRQSLPPRRVSSNAFPPVPGSPSPSGAAPSPQKAAVASDANGTVPEGYKALSPAKPPVPDDRAGTKETGAVEKIKETGKNLVEGVKQLAVGGDRNADAPIAKDPSAPTELATPKKEKLGGSPESPNAKLNSGKSAPPKSPSTRLQSVRRPGPPPASSSTPGAALTPAKSPRTAAPSTAKASSPAPKAPPTKPAPDSKPSAAKPTPATRTPRLVPSATGPARHTPPNGVAPSHLETSPLKAQLTGTPSRPTASYLAKTRSPNSAAWQAEKRPSGSTPRSASGSTPARSKPSTSPSPGPSGAAPRSTTASGSRLLQGTAASRAKAAEAKAPASSIKSRTSHPPRPSVTAPVAASSSAKPSSTQVPPRKQAESKRSAPVKPPAGARIGLAAAGMGQGGKTGRELNDELSAKLKSGEITGEEIVRRGEEGTLGQLTMGLNEEENVASSRAQPDEDMRGDSAGHQAGSAGDAVATAANAGERGVAQANVGDEAGEEEESGKVETSSASPGGPGQTGEGTVEPALKADAAGDRVEGQGDIQEIPDL